MVMQLKVIYRGWVLHFEVMLSPSVHPPVRLFGFSISWKGILHFFVCI